MFPLCPPCCSYRDTRVRVTLPCSYHDNLHTNMQLPVLYYSVLYCTVLQFTGLVCTQYLLVTFLHPHPAQVRNIKQSSGCISSSRGVNKISRSWQHSDGGGGVRDDPQGEETFVGSSLSSWYFAIVYLQSKFNSSFHCS